MGDYLGVRRYAAVGMLVAALVPAGQPDGDLAVVAVDVSAYPEIELVVSVPPAAHPLDPAEAFEVVEGDEPRPVDGVRVPAAEVEVALLVDTVSVPGRTLREVQGAATEVALRLPPEAAVSVATMRGPPATDAVQPASLHARVASVGALVHEGPRAMHDAILLALDRFSPRDGVPRSIVLVGGGVDAASEARLDQVIARLTELGVSVHALHWQVDDAARQAIESVAEPTGGTVATITSTEDPASEIEQIVARVSNLYRLTFVVREAGPTEVEIRALRDDRTARTTVSLQPPADGDAHRPGVSDAPRPPEAGGSTGEAAELDHGTGQVAEHAAPPQDAPLGAVGGLVPAAAAAAAVSLAVMVAWALASGRHRHADAPVALAPAGVMRAPRARARARPPTGAVGARRHAAQAAVREATRKAVVAAATAVNTAMRSAARAVEHSGMAASQQLVRLLRAYVAAVAGVARVGPDVIVDHVHRRRPAREPVDSAPGWRDVAKEVHADLGGDLAVLLRIAERIESGRRRSAEEVRSIDTAARFAVWIVGAVPLCVVSVRAAVDPGYLPRLSEQILSLEVAAAAVLTMGGVWGLYRVSQPPYSLRPSARRAFQQRRALVGRLGGVLEHAALCAAAGLDVESALRLAARSDPSGPGRRLMQLGEERAGELSAPDRESLAGSCLRALIDWSKGGVEAHDALASTATRLYLEDEWARWRRLRMLPVALAVPALAGIVPAAVLLAWL